MVQQFGRDIIQLAPEAVKMGKTEVAAQRDPDLDKGIYWTGRGGQAEQDALDHKLWVEGDLTPEEKVLLARLQTEGRVGWWNLSKPRHRRPWTGAWWFWHQLRSGALDAQGNERHSDS